MRMIRIQNNQWTLKHCPVLCIVQFAALYAQKCDLLPPATHTFLKWPFLTDFKKYTHTPPKGTKFWRIGPKVYKTQEKCQTHCVGAPREICVYVYEDTRRTHSVYATYMQ